MAMSMDGPRIRPARMGLKVVFLVVVAMLTALIGPAAAFVFEDSTVEFSADMMLYGDGRPMKGHLNAVPGKQRMQVDDAMMGRPVIVISDEVANKAWLLDPSSKSYLEYSLDKIPVMLRREDWDKLERASLGRETVGGVTTTKYAVEGRDPSGDLISGLAWLSDDGILVRFEGQTVKNGRKIDSRGELSNIQIGRQDSALFTVPADFRPGGMMMGKGSGRGTGQGSGAGASPGMSQGMIDQIIQTMRQQGLSEAQIQQMLKNIPGAGN